MSEPKLRRNSGRYVTAPEISRSEADWDHISGRHEPKQRLRIYRLCPCELCEASGKVDEQRCPDCRGEGRGLDLIATCGTPEAVGAALVELGREGEFDHCPVGLLDLEGESGRKWLISPWLPSARNISDAGRTLAGARHQKGERA